MNNYRLYIFFFIGFLAGISVGIGQSVKLMGKVIDARSGESLRGVNITVPNTFYGTITNDAGLFQIMMPSASLPAAVVFSRVGYEETRLKVVTPNDDLKISLTSLEAAENAQEQASATVAEYRVKINLIRILAEKISWPATETSSMPPFTIAIIGYNPFGDDLFAFEKIQIHDQKVNVVFLGNASEIANPEVLIISKPGRKLMEEIGHQVSQKSILTICDNCETGDKQTVIELETMDGKVRFRVNDEAVKAAGLTIGADLRKAAYQ